MRFIALSVLLLAAPAAAQNRTEKRLTGLEKRVTGVEKRVTRLEGGSAAAGPRAGLVELLAGEPGLLVGLVRVCAGGDLLTQLLIAQPELLASLAGPERLLRRKAAREFRAALAPVFAPGVSTVEARDRLRRGKQAEELAVVWRYLLDVTSI